MSPANGDLEENNRSRPLRSKILSATLLPMDVKLRYRGRDVTDSDIAFIRQLMAHHPSASRRRLSQILCEA